MGWAEPCDSSAKINGYVGGTTFTCCVLYSTRQGWWWSLPAGGAPNWYRFLRRTCEADWTLKKVPWSVHDFDLRYGERVRLCVFSGPTPFWGSCLSISEPFKTEYHARATPNSGEGHLLIIVWKLLYVIQHIPINTSALYPTVRPILSQCDLTMWSTKCSMTTTQKVKGAKAHEKDDIVILLV